MASTWVADVVASATMTGRPNAMLSNSLLELHPSVPGLLWIHQRHEDVEAGVNFGDVVLRHRPDETDVGRAGAHSADPIGPWSIATDYELHGITVQVLHGLNGFLEPPMGAERADVPDDERVCGGPVEWRDGVDGDVRNLNRPLGNGGGVLGKSKEVCDDEQVRGSDDPALHGRGDPGENVRP